MSGDVQPRKRKDKRKKKEGGSLGMIHDSASMNKFRNYESSDKKGFQDFQGDQGERIHVQNEHGVGGNICVKIIFFCLLGALVGAVGLIYLQSQGSTDVDLPSLEDSRFAEYFTGWLDESTDDHDHEPSEGEHAAGDEGHDHDEDDEEEGKAGGGGGDAHDHEEDESPEQDLNVLEPITRLFNFGGGQEESQETATEEAVTPSGEEQEEPEEDQGDEEEDARSNEVPDDEPGTEEDESDENPDNDDDEDDDEDNTSTRQDEDEGESEENDEADDDVYVKLRKRHDEADSEMEDDDDEEEERDVTEEDKSNEADNDEIDNNSPDSEEEEDETNGDEDEDDEDKYDASQNFDDDDDDEEDRMPDDKDDDDDEPVNIVKRKIEFEKSEPIDVDDNDEGVEESEEEETSDEPEPEPEKSKPRARDDKEDDDDEGYDEIDESDEEDRSGQDVPSHVESEPEPDNDDESAGSETTADGETEPETEESGVTGKVVVGIALVIVAHLVLVQKWRTKETTPDEVAGIPGPEPVISRRQTLVPENVSLGQILDEDDEEEEEEDEEDEEEEDGDDDDDDDGEEYSGDEDEYSDKEELIKSEKCRTLQMCPTNNTTDSNKSRVDDDEEEEEDEDEGAEEEEEDDVEDEEDLDDEEEEEELGEEEEDLDAEEVEEEEEGDEEDAEEEEDDFENIDDKFEYFVNDKNLSSTTDTPPVPPPRANKRGGLSAEDEDEGETDDVEQLTGTSTEGPYHALHEAAQRVEEVVSEEPEPVARTVGNEEEWPFRDDFKYADEQFENNPKAALRTFDQILARKPNLLRALIGRARVLDHMAELERSNLYLKQATHAYRTLLLTEGRRIDDDMFEKLAERCISRMRFGGHLSSAIEVHKALVLRFPNVPKYRNTLAVTYLMLNNIEPARRVLNETLRRWPDNGFALVHYGFIVKTTDNDMERGAKLLMDGIRTKEEGVIDGMFFFHLGDALNRLGRASEAMTWYDLGVKEGLFLSRYQRSLYNINRLKSRPWWTKEQTTYQEFFKRLETNWREIRKEGLDLLNSKGVNLFKEEAENLKDTGDWRQLDLFFRGRKQANCQKAPVTCSLVSQFKPAAGCTRGQIKFSVMWPDTHVWPHCGPTNCRLRSHLGLVVPPKTFIRVAEETRSWEEGKFLVFDDSFEHEVWHNGTGPRLVLIIDVWHPEVTQHERQTLSPI